MGGQKHSGTTATNDSTNNAKKLLFSETALWVKGAQLSIERCEENNESVENKRKVERELARASVNAFRRVLQ